MYHECNAWCKPDDNIHCCLVYTTQNWNEQTMQVELERLRPIKVIAIESAKEAPGLPLGEYEDLSSGSVAYDNNQAHL